MNKRQKFIITSLLLSIGFLTIQLANIPWRYQAILGLAALSLFFFVFSLWEGLSLKHRPTTLLTLILPPLFTAGIGLFYFLLPAHHLARLPVVLVYGLGIYSLLLTANIFTVAAIRTIQLVRAARAVSFVLILVTSFLLFDTVWSLRFPAYFNFLLIGGISFPLFLHGLWSVQFEEHVSPAIWQLAALSTLAVAELAVALSFWPVSIVIASLYLTTAIYVILGLAQNKLAGRLFAKTIREHFIFGALFLCVLLLTTSWRG